MFETVRAKIESREKHYGKQRKFKKKTGERLCGTRRTVRENEGEHVGNCHSRIFLRHLVTSSQAALYIDKTTRECWEISIFPCKAIRKSQHAAR